MPAAAFLTRGVLKNYKSIAACNVELGPLMFLVDAIARVKVTFWMLCALFRTRLTSRLIRLFANATASRKYVGVQEAIPPISACAWSFGCQQAIQGTMLSALARHLKAGLKVSVK